MRISQKRKTRAMSRAQKHERKNEKHRIAKHKVSQKRPPASLPAMYSITGQRRSAHD